MAVRRRHDQARRRSTSAASRSSTSPRRRGRPSRASSARMSIVLAAVIVVVVAALAIAAMLFVRRRAPEGSYFADGDRAVGRVRRARHRVRDPRSASSSSWPSRATTRRARGAETEARIIAQQFETAQFLPAPAPRGADRRARLLRPLRRAPGVAADGRTAPLGDDAQPVGRRAVPHAAHGRPADRRREQSAYDSWLDQTSDREQARSDRIHGAVGVIPTPLWIVLFLSAAIIFVYMLFFADSGERAVVQAMLMGSVAAVSRRCCCSCWSSTTRSTAASDR